MLQKILVKAEKVEKIMNAIKGAEVRGLSELFDR